MPGNILQPKNLWHFYSIEKNENYHANYQKHPLQNIEPYENWRYLYTAEEDQLSPFYGREYSEFEFTKAVYNYYIHPQWDEFGSTTLYIKVLMADYASKYVIIEMIGEWNDAIENDIMTFKRDVIDIMIKDGISKFILIAESVLNFHSSDSSYYEEWFEDVTDENGWIVCLNMPEQTQYDFKRARLHHYIELMSFPQWRTLKPDVVFMQIDNILLRRLDL